MSKRALLPVFALFLLAGCAASHDATITAAGSPPTDAFQASGHSTTTATASIPTLTTAPTPTSTAVATVSSTTTASAPTTTTQKRLSSTTTTTLPVGAIRLTIVNEHPNAVDVGVNGVKYSLGPGKHLGPVAVIPRADRNDAYSAVVHGTQCGLGDSGPFFQKDPGTSITIRLVPEGTCEPGGPGVPNLSVIFEG